MRDGRGTADLAAFLICLCLGFTFSFEVLIPGLRDIQMEMMRYLFGVGFGFGLGVCFYLITASLLHLISHAYERFWTFQESRAEKSAQGKSKRRSPSSGEDCEDADE